MKTSLAAKKQSAPWIKTTTKKHFLLLGGKDHKLQIVPLSEPKQNTKTRWSTTKRVYTHHQDNHSCFS